MKTTTAQRRNGIQWTMWKQLEYLDFADDLALLLQTHQHVQENTSYNTSQLEIISARDCLKIHSDKTKLLGINTANDGQIMLEGNGLEKVEPFTHLGNIPINRCMAIASISVLEVSQPLVSGERFCFLVSKFGFCLLPLASLFRQLIGHFVSMYAGMCRYPFKYGCCS